VTKGQSIGDFPAVFREMVRWEVGNGLSLVPLCHHGRGRDRGGTTCRASRPAAAFTPIGGNELASRFSGIRVERVKLSV